VNFVHLANFYRPTLSTVVYGVTSSVRLSQAGTVPSALGWVTI